MSDDSFIRSLLERVRSQTDIQRGRRSRAAVMASSSTDEPKRGTEKQAVEAWCRLAANRLRGREMSSTQEECLPVQIARLHHRTRNQNKRQWAPLSQSLDSEGRDDSTRVAAAALSQLLDSVKLRNLAVLSTQNPGVTYQTPVQEGLESLPLTKLILYRNKAESDCSGPLDEAESRDQVEFALTRMRPDYPGVLKLLDSSRLLREEANRL